MYSLVVAVANNLLAALLRSAEIKQYNYYYYILY